MRIVLAVVLGAAVAALGALILGEYPFTGILILLGAVILALFVDEVYLWASRAPGLVAGAVCGTLTAAGVLWGGWISTGHHLDSLPGWGWAAVAAGAVVAALRAGWKRPAGSRPASSHRE